MADENESTICAATGPIGTQSPVESPVEVPVLSGCSVYVMEAGEHTKIGVATEPRARLKSLQAGCPLEIHLLGHLRFASFPVARAIEAEMHNVFAEFRGHGEWFHMPSSWALNGLRQKIGMSAATSEEAHSSLADMDFCPRPRWKLPQDAWGYYERFDEGDDF
jgi:hypothetical protein